MDLENITVNIFRDGAYDIQTYVDILRGIVRIDHQNSRGSEFQLGNFWDDGAVNQHQVSLIKG